MSQYMCLTENAKYQGLIQVAIKGIKYFKIYFHCVRIGLFLVTPLVPAMLIVTKSWTKDVYVAQQTLEITKTEP